jgi:dipeptidyl aminopeptidase/acylaminoacyl peptidase
VRAALLGLVLIACKGSSRTPSAAHDARVSETRTVADARAADPMRPPLGEDERHSLRGTIHASAGREDGFRVVAIDPSGTVETRTLTPPGASYFPVPGKAPLAIRAVEIGDTHSEQIVLLGAGPDDLRTLGPASPHVRTPSVTPDGAAVIFEADSASFRDLYRVDVATGAATRLTDEKNGNFEPSPSPDGTQLAFTSSRDGDTEIYVMPLGGGAATRLTHFHKDDWAPQWSPDGAWIAFLSDREGAPRVFLTRPDGTGTRHAHEDVPAGEEMDFAWSPTGDRIAYVASTRAGASEVWVADIASTKASRVSAAGARDEVPSWSPDGRHLVYVSTRDQRIDLWVARADGTAESRLTDTPEEEWIPRWRP